jgi:hypothetical protein
VKPTIFPCLLSAACPAPPLVAQAGPPVAPNSSPVRELVVVCKTEHRQPNTES